MLKLALFILGNLYELCLVLVHLSPLACKKKLNTNFPQKQHFTPQGAKLKLKKSKKFMLLVVTLFFDNPITRISSTLFVWYTPPKIQTKKHLSLAKS